MVQIESQVEPPSSERARADRAQFAALVMLSEAELRRRLSVNVRLHRNAASLTLKVVAGRAGMHWRHWQKIEAAQVNATLQTLVRIADALNVDPATLLNAPPAPPSSRAP